MQNIQYKIVINLQDTVTTRVPRTGDTVLYGGSTDAEGKVREVPAMILEVQTPGEADSRVDLETIKIGLDPGIHSAVRYVQDPEHGCWRWKPER